MIKEAYRLGVQAALMKMGLDDTRSSPYTIQYQQPTTSPEGRSDMIDQAFSRNESLGNPSEGDPPMSNPSLLPSLPPVGRHDLRNFGSWETDSDGSAFSYEGGLP